MKRSFLAFVPVLVLGLGGGRVSVRADDVLPQPAAPGRYARMADRSPFAPPTIMLAAAAATPPPPGPKWSDNLTVTLLTQQGGVYFVTIQDKAKNERFLLQSNKEDTERQLEVASVQWGELVDQTTVTLRHNEEFAPVRFDASAATATAAPIPNPPSLPRRVPVAGTYPPSAGTPAPGHFQPPPNPSRVPNAARRASMIRATPAPEAPTLQPPLSLPRRPLSGGEDEDR